MQFEGDRRYRCWPWMRLMSIAVAVAGGMALWGCGNEGHAGGVAEGAKSGLGAARFDALDRIFVTSLPLEGSRNEAGTASAYASAARPAHEACDAAIHVDALIAPRGT